MQRLNGTDDPEEVLQRYEKLLDRQIRVHGVDGGPTANARGMVAKQLEKMERLVEARVLWEQTVAAYRRSRGADDIYTMEYEEWLAANLMKSGLRREARPLVVHICDVRLRTLGAGNEATIRAQRRLEVLDGASGR